MTGKGQMQGRKKAGVPAVPPKDLHMAFNLFRTKVAQPAVHLPGLGSNRFHDEEGFPLFGPLDMAIGEAGDALRAQGYDEDVCAPLLDRAYSLYHILPKLQVSEPSPEILNVAATINLPFGSTSFPTAQFLKALKTTV